MRSSSIFLLLINILGIILCKDKLQSDSLSNINNQELQNIFLSNKCNNVQKVNKFGLFTVTQFRIDSNNNDKQGIQFFKQYLQQFAQMQCDVFDSIYFVWNNQKQPQQYGILQGKNHWKKNVFFLHSKQNSMDNRFIVPQWVQQQVFFSLDDDAKIDCNNLKKAFNQWKQLSIQNIGPLATYSARTANYDVQKDMFWYRFYTKSYISLALPNIAIIPRHYMDIYYSQIYEFQKIRQIVRQYSNCDDLALNFMVNYLYPEFNTFLFKDIKAQLKKSKVQIYKSSDHWEKRDNCLKKFTQLLGSNTNKYNIINQNTSYTKLKTNPNKDFSCLTQIKKLIVQNKYINHQAYYLKLKKIYYYMKSQNEQLVKRINKDNVLLQLPQKQKKQRIQNKQISIKFKSKNTISKILNITYAIHLKEQNLSQKQNQQISNPSQQQLQKIKQYALILILIMFLIYSFVGLYYLCRLIQIKLKGISDGKQNNIKIKEEQLSSYSQRSDTFN